MPSTSAKQAKFMRAVAHSPKFAKKVGVPQSVGKDFNMADKRAKKFGSGGDIKKPRPFDDPDAERIPTKEEAAKLMQPTPPKKPVKKDPDTLGIKKNAKGGKVMKKYPTGGAVTANTTTNTAASRTAAPSDRAAKFKATNDANRARLAALASANTTTNTAASRTAAPRGLTREQFMANQNKAESDRAAKVKASNDADRARRVALASAKPKTVTAPSSGITAKNYTTNITAKKYAAGGLAKAHKSADGIAKKGKTRAMMPKMAKGGKMKGCK